MEISPNSAEYPTEAGYQLLLQGRTRDAFKCYKNAMKLDETSVVALTGIRKGGHFLKEFFLLYEDQIILHLIFVLFYLATTFSFLFLFAPMVTTRDRTLVIFPPFILFG